MHTEHVPWNALVAVKVGDTTGKLDTRRSVCVYVFGKDASVYDLS